MLPLNPTSQGQPNGTPAPVESAGHATTLQLLEKNGDETIASTLPLYPASQTQPNGTSGPVEFAGHGEAMHGAPMKLPPDDELQAHAPPPLCPAEQLTSTVVPSEPLSEPGLP